MNLGLDGKTAIVTGGGRGVGQGIARTLTDLGVDVLVWDIDPATENNAHHTVQHLLVDVANEQSVIEGMQRSIELLGRIDILVNNAGVNGPTVPAEEYSLSDWSRVIDIDLTGVFLCSRALIAHMKQRQSGRIINVASIAGKEGNANACAYSAAKAGVIGLTKSLAKELVAHGITVNCIAPVMVETDMLREMTSDYINTIKSKIPLGRFCTVEEIADTVAWIASSRCGFSTGVVFDLSGGRATY